jgi:hypothetical protein
MTSAAVGIGLTEVISDLNATSYLGPHHRGGKNLSAVRSNPLSLVIASLLISDKTRLLFLLFITNSEGIQSGLIRY